MKYWDPKNNKFRIKKVPKPIIIKPKPFKVKPLIPKLLTPKPYKSILKKTNTPKYFNTKLNIYPKRTKREIKLIDKNPWKDFDKDGVINIFDCRPMNKRKQGYFEEKYLGKKTEKIYPYRSNAEREKLVKTKIRKSKEKEFNEPHNPYGTKYEKDKEDKKFERELRNEIRGRMNKDKEVQKAKKGLKEIKDYRKSLKDSKVETSEDYEYSLDVEEDKRKEKLMDAKEKIMLYKQKDMEDEEYEEDEDEDYEKEKYEEEMKMIKELKGESSEDSDEDDYEGLDEISFDDEDAFEDEDEDED